jgi:hypothetical protein
MDRTKGTKNGPTNATSGAPEPAARLDIFGPAPLIEGEDAAAYDELLVRISAAVKPADILEDIWVREIVDLVWGAFRLRRFKTSPIKWVNDILASAGRTTNGIVTQTLSRNLDHVERIEHMIAMAETRRNVILREIDRHRETLAHAPRRAAHQLEQDEIQVIDDMKSAEEKNAT